MIIIISENWYSISRVISLTEHDSLASLMLSLFSAKHECQMIDPRSTQVYALLEIFSMKIRWKFRDTFETPLKSQVFIGNIMKSIWKNQWKCCENKCIFTTFSLIFSYTFHDVTNENLTFKGVSKVSRNFHLIFMGKISSSDEYDVALQR